MCIPQLLEQALTVRCRVEELRDLDNRGPWAVAFRAQRGCYYRAQGFLNHVVSDDDASNYFRVPKSVKKLLIPKHRPDSPCRIRALEGGIYM